MTPWFRIVATEREIFEERREAFLRDHSLDFVVPRLVAGMRWGVPYTSENLVEIAYADDPNGGPLSGTHTLLSNLSRRRPHLRRYGFDITGVRAQRGSIKFRLCDPEPRV